MTRHKHRFTATPITGKNACDGKEYLFGYRLDCEQCSRQAKPGDVIEEVKASWWKEVIPESKAIHYVLPA